MDLHKNINFLSLMIGQDHASGQEQIQQNSNAELEQNEYGSPQYWEQRYIKSKGERFDWLENYETLKQLIIKLTNKNLNTKILNIGCGNGQIQDHLYNYGFHHIYNNDISHQVIKQMNRIKNIKNQSEMVYEVMDVTRMTYPDSSFDLVLDKSTIDALLCSDHPFLNTAKMLQQVYRVLSSNGVYLVISYSAPQNRIHHLKRSHICFDVEMEIIEKEVQNGNKLTHYAYICYKKGCIKLSEQEKEVFYQKLKKQEEEYYGS